MDVIVMVGQLLLGLSILVGLHELGHLVSAKVFGMRVEKYFIGFPPKVFGINWRGTEYGLGAIPLGGFVKISGMVDESLDTEMLAQEPQPWEFRAKPAWQRLIVMMGGIIVNVITGIVIFVFLVYANGEHYLPAKEVKYGIVAHEMAQQIGLRTGDRILAINGKPFEKFNDIQSSDVLLGNNSYYTVERNGQTIDIPVPNDFVEQLSANKNAGLFVTPIAPFEVGDIQSGYPAEKAGLKPGDKIVNIAGTPIRFFHELQAALEAHKNKPVTLQVLRKGQSLNLNATVTAEGRLGFMPQLLLNEETTHYSLLQSIPIGAEQAFNVVYMNIKGFAKIFRGEVSLRSSVSGPIGIAKMYGVTWNWDKFWAMTGLLSMVLAFMNFLPIPALDGGHVMFLTYEMVSGRKPSDKFLEISQKVGMAILLSLMAFAFFNDIVKLIF